VSEISPAAQALRTLEILQSHPGTTADERLGVTERAARRYIGILREAGIAVEPARGPHGGYRLRRGLDAVRAAVRLRPGNVVRIRCCSLRRAR